MSAPIETTVQTRVLTMDFARGIAIMGILLANVAAFFGPMLDYSVAIPKGEEMIHALHNILVSGKFRGMLAILFGVGMAMQFSKRKFAGLAWPNTYLKRMMVLGVIGLIHISFVWMGDILLTYAVGALLLFWMVQVNDQILKWIIGAGIFLSVLLGFGFAALMDVPKFAEAMGAVDEFQLYGQQGYLQQLLFRLPMAFTMIFNALLLAPSLAALFGMGILLARHGILANLRQHGATVKKVMLLSFGIGLPLQLVGAWLMVQNGSINWGVVNDWGFSLFLAPGYLLAFGLLCEKLRESAVVRGFSNVGRVAMSTYLLQSVVGTTLAYSWGLGLYGKLTFVQELLAAVGIMAVTFIAAQLMVRAGQGPVERLWRRLSATKPVPQVVPPPQTF